MFLFRYNECKEKLLPYLKKLGFNPQKDLTFMPCSGLTGAGLKEPVDSKLCPWFTWVLNSRRLAFKLKKKKTGLISWFCVCSGQPFIPFIEEMPPMVRFVDRPFIMPIVDKYKDMGTVVLGKVEAGEARKGQTLLVLPNKTQVVVDQLWSDEDEVTAVGPGENVKIKLKGVEEEDISSGFVLCDPNNTCKTGRIFDAQVIVNTILDLFILINFIQTKFKKKINSRLLFSSIEASFAPVTLLFATFTRSLRRSQLKRSFVLWTRKLVKSLKLGHDSSSRTRLQLCALKPPV